MAVANRSVLFGLPLSDPNAPEIARRMAWPYAQAAVLLTAVSATVVRRSAIWFASAGLTLAFFFFGHAHHQPLSLAVGFAMATVCMSCAHVSALATVCPDDTGQETWNFLFALFHGLILPPMCTWPYHVCHGVLVFVVISVNVDIFRRMRTDFMAEEQGRSVLIVAIMQLSAVLVLQAWCSAKVARMVAAQEAAQRADVRARAVGSETHASRGDLHHSPGDLPGHVVHSTASSDRILADPTPTELSEETMSQWSGKEAVDSWVPVSPQLQTAEGKSAAD